MYNNNNLLFKIIYSCCRAYSKKYLIVENGKLLRLCYENVVQTVKTEKPKI